MSMNKMEAAKKQERASCQPKCTSSFRPDRIAGRDMLKYLKELITLVERKPGG
jgi:hypothetical protein